MYERPSDKIFMMFGTMMGAIRDHIPFNDWASHADLVWEWCKAKMREYDKEFGRLPSADEKPKPTDKPKENSDKPVKFISEAQLKRFFGKAKASGYTNDGMKALLAKYGISSFKMIPTSLYEDLCELADDTDAAQQYNS